MRDNLIFYNIKERENENMEEVVRQFCGSKLKLNDFIHGVKWTESTGWEGK